MAYFELITYLLKFLEDYKKRQVDDLKKKDLEIDRLMSVIYEKDREILRIKDENQAQISLLNLKYERMLNDSKASVY